MDELKDLHRFVHVSTFQCAKSHCIPCLYKIFPSGYVPNDSSATGFKLPPNQRPENCTRFNRNFVKNSTSLLYDLLKQDSRVLTLGDGDFSYSLCIAESNSCVGMKSQIVATSYESEETVINVYPTGRENLQKLLARNVTVKHSVDAANLLQSFQMSDFPGPALLFDVVVWNFPCIAARNGADGQTTELEENRELLRNFFNNIHQFLVHDPAEGRIGAVHVTHKTSEPFSWWGIRRIAEECDLNFHGAVVFDRCNYPGYVNRKALDKKSFPVHDALTYVFTSKRNRTASLVQEEVVITEYCSGWNLENNPKLLSLRSESVIQALVDASRSLVTEDERANKKCKR